MSAASSETLPRPNLLSVLRSRNFALLWGGQAISQLGDQLFSIALMWLVLQMTGSALALGTVAILGQLPRLAFQFIGGATVDRYDRRRMMLTSDALRAVVVLAFAVLVATNQIQMLHVYVLWVIFGTVMAFFHPAQSALLPNLVPREGLMAANSLVSLTQQFTQIIGPALAGLLIAIPVIGIAGVSFLNAASFGVGAIGVALMQVPAHANRARQIHGSFWHELRDGVHYLFGFRALVLILLLAMILNFALGPFEVLLPVLAKTTLRLGSEGCGALISALTVGLVVGSLVIGPRPPHAHRGVLTFSLMALGGVLTAVTSLLGLMLREIRELQ